MAGTARQSTDWVAGAAGFEPAHGGTKSRCLTTWLRPNRGRTLVPARSTGKSPGRQRARANWCAKRAGPRQITLAEEPARRYTPRRWFRSVAQLGRALSSGGRGREFESRHSDQLFKRLASRPSRLSRILAHPSSQGAVQRRLAGRAQDRPWAPPASPLARSKQKKPNAAPVPDLRCSPGGFRFPPVR